MSVRSAYHDCNTGGVESATKFPGNKPLEYGTLGLGKYATSFTTPDAIANTADVAETRFCNFRPFLSAVDKASVTTCVKVKGEKLPPVRVYRLLALPKEMATTCIEDGLTGSSKLKTRTPVFKLNVVPLCITTGPKLSRVYVLTLYGDWYVAVTLP